MVVLTSKLKLQGFLLRNYYSQRIHVANLILLIPIQAKIKALKISYYEPHCANEYAKEKEEKEKTQQFLQNIIGSF